MAAFELYQRDDCPLCDEALATLAAAQWPDFDSIWINDAPALERVYGRRVPVLRHIASGVELDWPFEPAQLRAWRALISR